MSTNSTVITDVPIDGIFPPVNWTGPTKIKKIDVIGAGGFGGSYFNDPNSSTFIVGSGGGGAGVRVSLNFPSGFSLDRDTNPLKILKIGKVGTPQSTQDDRNTHILIEAHSVEVIATGGYDSNAVNGGNGGSFNPAYLVNVPHPITYTSIDGGGGGGLYDGPSYSSVGLGGMSKLNPLYNGKNATLNGLKSAGGNGYGYNYNLNIGLGEVSSSQYYLNFYGGGGASTNYNDPGTNGWYLANAGTYVYGDRTLTPGNGVFYGGGAGGNGGDGVDPPNQPYNINEPAPGAIIIYFAT